VVAPAKDQRNVLMKGVGRQTAPSEDPSLRQPLCRRHQPRSPPRPVPIASRVLTRSEPRKPPATAGHNLRRVFFERIYGIGFTLRPPLEIGLMSRPHDYRPRSAPVSRLGLPARTPISPRLNRASPAVMCLVREGGSDERPLTGRPLRLQRVVSNRRDFGSRR
jgi:hypothetical protein